MTRQILSLSERTAPTPPNTHFVMLPTSILSVLSQQRSEMSEEGLEELASSIKSSKQMYPGIVFAFSSREAQKYLREINKLWGSNHKLSDFKPTFIEEKSGSFYLFVVAGHRRLRACMRAQVDYYAQVVFGSSFEKALATQLEENFHESVPLGDQIRSAHALWMRAKEKDPKMTLRAFSRKIHKSATWLKKALRFSGLPLSAQRLLSYKGEAAPKGIPYGVLLEFASLHEHAGDKISEERLVSYIFHAVARKMSLKDVRGLCDVVRMELDGQDTLFALASVSDANERSLATAKAAATTSLRHAQEYLEGIPALARLATDTGRHRAGHVMQAAETVLELVA
jgi:hypothetical protein